MALIRFGPMTNAQDMAFIGLYEGEEPASEEVAEHLELAATLLVICEPPQLGLDEDTEAFLLRAPDATMADWRRAGLFEQLRASDVPYEAADAREQEGWDPSEDEPHTRARLLGLRIGDLGEDFDAALAMEWAAMRENDSSISADIDPDARRLAHALLGEVPLGDLTLDERVLSCALLIGDLERWDEHRLPRLLAAARLPHEIHIPARPGSGISTLRGRSADGQIITTRALADRRRCATRLDYEDLMLHIPDQDLPGALSRMLRPSRLFSDPARARTGAQPDKEHQAHRGGQDEHARPQGDQVDEYNGPGLVDDDKPGERHQADQEHGPPHADPIAG